MAQKERAAYPVGARRGGKNNNHGGSNTEAIIQHFDSLCTASAILTHDLADIAAERRHARLVFLALRLDAITIEIHGLARQLPHALEMAVAA